MVASNGSLVVLLVEDFDDAREMYEDYLMFQGMTVLCARDGAEGVRMAIEHSPDVVVMDAGLPKLTGWEASIMLRANPDTARIKILMLTGHVFKESEAKARDAGVDLFVSKPCLPDQLHGHIVALTRRDPGNGNVDAATGDPRQQPERRTRPRPASKRLPRRDRRKREA